MSRRKAVRPDYVAVPPSAPHTGTIFSIQMDEADVRALSAGAVPLHLQETCGSLLRWVIEDPVTGYAEGWLK